MIHDHEVNNVSYTQIKIDFKFLNTNYDIAVCDNASGRSLLHGNVVSMKVGGLLHIVNDMTGANLGLKGRTARRKY